MTIRKGKSDSPDIDDLMQDINQENRLSQEENRLEEKIAALRDATAALNAAADRADIIIKGLNKAIDHLQTTELGATIRPDTLKALNEVCDNFVIDVGRQLMAHRNKQLEQQKAHEQRITRMMESHEAHITRMQHKQQSIHEQRLADMLRKSRGLWISHSWLKFLTIIFIIYSLLVILYVKLGNRSSWTHFLE